MKNELYHWGLKSGEEKKGHKWISRGLIGTKNGKNIYRYDYGNGSANKVGKQKEQQKQKKSLSEKIKDVFNKAKNSLKKKLDEIKYSKVVQKGNAAVEKMLDATTKPKKKNPTPQQIYENKRKHKYIARITLPNGKYRYFYDQKELDAYYKKNGDSVEQQLLKECGLKNKNETEEQDAIDINEKFNEGIEYQMNCYSCSIAYDLRRRGYNADAIPDPDGLDISTIASCYKYKETDTFTTNTKPMKSREISFQMQNDMKNNGDGSYGMVFVKWKDGSNHVMNWEVKDGEVRIIDTQSNIAYKGNDITYLLSYTACQTTPGAAFWFRTDNKELDPSITQYVKKDEKEVA